MKTIAAAVVLGTVVAGGATLLTTSTSAASTTCHGRQVTITGSPQGHVAGTEGPDVILTNGAWTVTALGGDDTICVSGKNASRPFVQAGPGDDLVDTRAARGRQVFTQLGAGADTFVGGVVVDRVFDGSPIDAAVDDIDTGAGPDVLVSGYPGQVNQDRLRGGPGDDVFRVVGLLQLPGHLSPGGRHNRLHVEGSRASRTDIDLAARTLKQDGVTLVEWRGRIDQVRIIENADASNTVNFSGTAERDVLTLGHWGTTTVNAHLRGGDDRLDAAFNGFAPGSNFSAGPGTDTLLVNIERYPSGILNPWTGDVDLDLDAHHVDVEDSHPTSATIHGFARVLVGGFRSLSVAGDENDNAVVAMSCNIELDGRGGADALRARVPDRCRGAGDRRLVGGAGPDRLVGSGLDDVLIGGRGHDLAVGSGGNDTCRAEVTRTCERS